MKTLNKRQLLLIIKKLVITIDNKTELAEALGINPVQVYRWYSDVNKRHIPEKYRDEIIKYAKSDMVCKKIMILEYKKLINQYVELSK